MNSLTIVALAALTLLITGCTQRLDPADYSKLPQSEGEFIGSQLAPKSPWFYRGSDRSGHHLTYWYLRGAYYQDRALKVDLSLKVDDEFPLTGVQESWRAVEPIVDDAGQLIGFRSRSS